MVKIQSFSEIFETASLISNSKFGGERITKQYILNLDCCIFKHKRVLGNGNIKKSHAVIQKLCHSKNE